MGTVAAMMSSADVRAAKLQTSRKLLSRMSAEAGDSPDAEEELTLAAVNLLYVIGDSLHSLAVSIASIDEKMRRQV